MAKIEWTERAIEELEKLDKLTARRNFKKDLVVCQLNLNLIPIPIPYYLFNMLQKLESYRKGSKSNAER